jgi:hypothetical protein
MVDINGIVSVACMIDCLSTTPTSRVPAHAHVPRRRLWTNNYQWHKCTYVIFFCHDHEEIRSSPPADHTKTCVSIEIRLYAVLTHSPRSPALRSSKVLSRATRPGKAYEDASIADLLWPVYHKVSQKAAKKKRKEQSGNMLSTRRRLLQPQKEALGLRERDSSYIHNTTQPTRWKFYT